MTAKTIFLQNFLNDIGNSVHSMNTIAVALSTMNTSQAPTGLNISWNIGNVSSTKAMSRNFAVRSAIVYAVESLYEYLKSISNSPLWTDQNKIFSQVHGDSKAVKTYNFLKSLNITEEENLVLVELLCHWRNKVVHSYTSNAKLSASKRQTIESKRVIMISKLHSFDIDIALTNFSKQLYTLKDASTLISVALKCARLVEDYYISKLPDHEDMETYTQLLTKDESFYKIYSQNQSLKRARQIKKWLTIHYGYLNKKVISQLTE